MSHICIYNSHFFSLYPSNDVTLYLPQNNLMGKKLSATQMNEYNNKVQIFLIFLL
jgi:hypothetical protein